MSNIFSPSGFQPVRRLDGAAWTANMVARKIAAANTHTFFSGDPVVQLSTGYIDRVVPGSLPTQGLLGIFVGAEWLSSGKGSVTWANNFPGGDTTTDVTAYVISDPNVVLRAWVGTGSGGTAGGPVAFADIGQNINYQLGTGNALSGISGAYLDYATLGTTSTLPFTILGLVLNPPGVNGTDAASVGNLVEIGFNQQAYHIGTTGL